jgi:hypothetical protein
MQPPAVMGSIGNVVSFATVCYALRAGGLSIRISRTYEASVSGCVFTWIQDERPADLHTICERLHDSALASESSTT